MNRLPIAAALCALGLSGAAHAVEVRVDFTGVNSSPAAVNVFGTPVATITGHVIYETDTPGTLFSSFNGQTFNYSLSIKELSFELGSVFSGSKASDTGFGYVQVRDGSGVLPDRLSFNNMVLLGSETTGEPAGFTNAQITIGLASQAAALPSAALPGVFDPAIFNGQKNVSVFIARASGSQPTGVAVSFNYNLDSVVVTQVPEPTSYALLAVGLSLVGFAPRRRRPRAA